MIFEDIKLFDKALIDKKRLIGLDMGSKKIGIAISDLSRTIANPHSLITRNSIKKDCIALSKIINQEFCGIIIGWPILMNGEQSDNCIRIRKFAEILSNYFNLPIYLQDERFSTKMAMSSLELFDISRKKKHMLDDKISASYILQTALDLTKYIS